MAELNLREKLRQLLVRKGVKFVLKFSGLTFKRTLMAEEMEQVQHIRYQLYAEAGYINAADYPEGKFSDKYDGASANFLVLDKDKPVGTVRLILNSKIGFPTEHLFNFDRPKISRQNIAEISRLAIARQYRGGSRAAMIGLMKMIYEYANERHITYAYSFMPKRLEQSFRNFGLSFYLLHEKPLQKKHFMERNGLAGYFLRNQARPYLLSINETKTLFGL